MFYVCRRLMRISRTRPLWRNLPIRPEDENKVELKWTIIVDCYCGCNQNNHNVLWSFYFEIVWFRHLSDEKCFCCWCCCTFTLDWGTADFCWFLTKLIESIHRSVMFKQINDRTICCFIWKFCWRWLLLSCNCCQFGCYYCCGANNCPWAKNVG